MRIPGTFQNITTDFACNEQLPVDASVDALLSLVRECGSPPRCTALHGMHGLH
jgi:hypothetical protein